MMKNQKLDISILNLGHHNANRRVWVSNQNILKSGFKVGELVSEKHELEDGKLLLRNQTLEPKQFLVAPRASQAEPESKRIGK